MSSNYWIELAEEEYHERCVLLLDRVAEALANYEVHLQVRDISDAIGDEPADTAAYIRRVVAEDVRRYLVTATFAGFNGYLVPRTAVVDLSADLLNDPSGYVGRMVAKRLLNG